jgi:hypothetical protein
MSRLFLSRNIEGGNGAAGGNTDDMSCYPLAFQTFLHLLRDFVAGRSGASLRSALTIGHAMWIFNADSRPKATGNHWVAVAIDGVSHICLCFAVSLLMLWYTSGTQVCRVLRPASKGHAASDREVATARNGAELAMDNWAGTTGLGAIAGRRPLVRGVGACTISAPQLS